MLLTYVVNRMPAYTVLMLQSIACRMFDVPIHKVSREIAWTVLWLKYIRSTQNIKKRGRILNPQIGFLHM